MRLAELAEMIGKFPQSEYPYGAFISPRTYAEAVKACGARLAPSAVPPTDWTFFGLHLFPLEGVPDGSLWPRTKSGQIALNQFFERIDGNT